MSDTQPCPSCGADLPDAAVLCIDCGYDFRSGKKRQTVSRRIKRTIGSDPTTPGRITFAVVFVLGALAFMAVLPLFEVDPEDWGFYYFPTLSLLLLASAVGLGTGSRTVITRTRKGHPEMVQQSWICFLPTSTRHFDLEEWDGVYFDCVVSGDRTPDLYIVELGRNNRNEFATVYAGRSEQMMQALGEAIKDVAGLRLERK